MGVIVTTGMAGTGSSWLIGALAVASVGWLEWRRAHSIVASPRAAGLRVPLVLGTVNVRPR